MSFQEWMDSEKLQQLQDAFCDIADIVAYCVDDSMTAITHLSGNASAVERAEKYVDSPQLQALLERVEDGSLEEQVNEELDDGAGRAAVIAVKAENAVVFYWIIIDFLAQAEWDERFDRILDLLRDASHTFLESRANCFGAEAESRRSRYAEQEMSENLKTIEATTAIVQLLDSDEAIEQIMDKWLTILGEHIMMDSAELFQIYPETNTMDVLCEWRKPTLVSFFDKTSRVESYSFLYTEKPLVISTGKAMGVMEGDMERVGIRAVMVFPVIRQEGGGFMQLALNYRTAHSWTMSEIKFTADAVKVLQSILTKRIQKNSLAGSYAAMEAMLDNVGCAIYVTDKKTGEMLFANSRLQNTFSRELKDNTFIELIRQGVIEGRENGTYEIDHSEAGHWYDLAFKQITWVDGRDAILHSLYDITDKKVYQRRIEQQAYTDFLTGLFNRMCCERDLARQIDEAKKNNTTGALLYLDLDDFKHINDGLGHQYGDVLLKSISHSLQRIDGIQSTCYRMGGDEFVIVVSPEAYPKFDTIIEDIQKIFSKPWFLKDADYYCTMSMGIVKFPESGDSVPDLIKKADIAMYEAKKTGKNRVAYYNDGSDSISGKRLDMEKNMRDATVEGYAEFEVYYQPIINIQEDGEECAGAEALIRWNSSNLGFIPPAEFIPLAEYLGLINPIGNYVLREACHHCKQWNDNGFPDYKVNVNLSVVQLLQPDIVEIVEQTLKESGLNPKNLTLEVTESLAINDMERMKEILNNIKSLGVKIALDDFGTGYSSLNHIREIPFDVIKVDQNFVKDLADDAYSQSFIKMVAELAETIGVSVCVEGVEQPTQYEVLQGMKVKYIQGYYFDRPMTKECFESKYASLPMNEKEGIAKSEESV
ncbi:MAG: bifunctional diguanylate cyclase/phosphodiesterase [Lachnospiraceae bacterium]|nr:bifunctional diguanylate cyclase/phosphodiesterase [Lachnospiraceae bacterium]